MSNLIVPSAPAELKNYFAQHEAAITACFPVFARPVSQKMMRTFLQHLPRSEKLQKCSLSSVVGSFLQAAFLGLEVGGPAKEACIVPLWDKHNKRYYAQMWPMVQGLVKLAWRNPNIGAICSQVVCENDEFELSLMPPDIKHKPPVRTGRGAVIGAYAYFETTTGQRSSPEWCDLETLQKIRGCSANPTGPAWQQWGDQMYRKAPLKRLTKGMPKYVEVEGPGAGHALLDRAVQADNDALLGNDALEGAFELAGIPMPADEGAPEERGEPQVDEAAALRVDQPGGPQSAPWTEDFMEGAVPPERDR